MSDVQTSVCKPKKTVVVVEDHPLFRERLVQLIESVEDMAVAGVADSVVGAMDVIRSTRPDLAFVDITLRDSSGLDLIKELKAQKLDVPVLVLSMHDETLYAEKSLQAGAKGYLMKHAPGSEILKAMRKVLGGEVVLSENMMAQVFHWAVTGKGAEMEAGMRTLSEREVQVFEAIGLGRNVRDIAKALNLGTTTVHTYRARIKEKLGLRTRSEVAVAASRWLAEHKI